MCDRAAEFAGSDDGEESPYMKALLYLQTDLADVTDGTSQQEFLSCMGYLLAGQSNKNAEQRDNTKPDAENEDDMVASQLLAMPNTENGKSRATGAGSQINKLLWARRTRVFEAILEFLPESAVQPKDDLVSCTNAWESLV